MEESNNEMTVSEQNVSAVMEYLDTWNKTFKGIKAVMWSVCAMAFLTIVVLVFLFLSKFAQLESRVYILDQGRSLIALQSDGAQTKDLEVREHVTRFHELFFSIAPNQEAIQQNVDRAFVLCDRSAYDYYNDLNEKGYYQRMINANITQQMHVQEVEVDVSVYPYKAHVIAVHYVIRESNITAYNFESTCDLVNVQRSDSNPHGLMMEKFLVTKNELIATRQR